MIRLHLLGFIFDPFHIMETNDSFLSFACCLFSITLFPHVNTNVLNNVVNPLGWIFSNLETIQWDWLCGWTSLRQWTIGCLTKLSLCIMNLVLWLITKNLPCVSCLDLEAIIVTYMLSMANNRQTIGNHSVWECQNCTFKKFETWTSYWLMKLLKNFKLF